MTDLRQAAQMALEALEKSSPHGFYSCRCQGSNHLQACFWQRHQNAIGALRAALSAVQEPVAWANLGIDGEPALLSISQHPEDRENWANPVPLYLHPAPAAQPLTDEEFGKEWHRRTGRIMGTDRGLLLQAKYVTERAHGIGGGNADA